VFDFSRFSLKKYFLCLEVAPTRVSGLLFHVNDDRKITTLRFWEDFPVSFLFRQLRPLHLLPPVIVAVHPTLVYTAVLPVHFERQSASAPLGSIELENHISQILSRNFNIQRKAASKSLGVAELDAILVQSRLFEFKIGDNEVLDPIGVQGRKIKATLETTFTTRTVFDGWKDFFNLSGDFYFADANRARAAGLGKIWKLPYALITPDADSTHYYFSYEKLHKHSARQGTFSWGTSSLTSPLEERWGISRKGAWEILLSCQDGMSSQSLRAQIEALLGPSRSSFFKFLDRLKILGATSLHSMPPALLDGGGTPEHFVKLQEPPLSSLLAKLGFTFQAKAEISPSRLFDFMAYYLEFYYDKSNSVINRWLKRRVHWLTPTH
jgi:hypothetical protein